VVVLEAAGEGVQVGLVVGVDGFDPCVEAVAVQAGEDLGELGDVAGEGVQVRAAFPGLGEFVFLVVAEVVRVGKDPAGEIAGLGRAGDGGWGGAGLAERLDVAADGGVAAAVTAFAELGVQLADVGAALVPPLVQAGLVVVEERRPSVPDLGEQFARGGGAVETADGSLARPVSRMIGLMPLPWARSAWTCSYRWRVRTARAGSSARRAAAAAAACCRSGAA
jgi:hypothetical protein